MQVVNLFDITFSAAGPDGARASRASRSGYRLYQAMRHGTKFNPTTVWLDASIAVLDAAAAYCRYRQAREITLALEADCNRLRHLLENELTMMGLQLDKIWMEEDARQSLLEQHLVANRDAASHLQQKIVTNRELMESILFHLENLRKTQGNTTQKFLALESASHQLMRAHLGCILYEISA